MKKQFHKALPQVLSAEELAQWLRNNAVEKFTDEQKRYFEEEDLRNFEHESSVNGREFNRLNDLKSKVAALCSKGTKEDVTFTIPATVGSKALDIFRRQNDDLVERGYEVNEVEVFAIPVAETKSMEFFDIEGNHIAERSRPMSAKERHAHLGIFGMNTEVVKNDIVDTESGEVLGQTGTE